MFKRFISLAFVATITNVFLTAHVFAYTNPTHFVDTQWNLMAASGYDSLEVDITPQIEESTTSDGYYSANTVYFRNYTGNNFGGAYAGIQTNGYDGDSYVGKMALFSVWDVTTGIAEPGGKGTAFTGEGTGFSARLPYNWTVGTTYRLKIYIDQDASSGNRLWGASLTNLTNGVTTRIGRVYVPVTRGKIYGPVTFHERYMGGTSCSDIKKSQVKFSNATANNGAIKASSWNNYAKSQVPECPGLVWLQDESGGVVSGVGTTKPAATVAPTAPVTKPKVTAVTPVVPKTEPSSTPTPTTETKTNETVQVVKEVPAVANDEQIRTKKTNAPLVFGAAAGVIGFGIAFVLVLNYLRRRKLNQYLKRHFPFDPDITHID